MDFSLSEDQISLRDLATQILTENSTDETLREFARSAETYDRGLWSVLAEAGFLGLGISEEYGGIGFGMIEVGMLLQEAGRTLAPVPILPTLVLGARPIQLFGTPAQKQNLLPRIARGDAIVTGAIEEPGNSDPLRPMLRATCEGGAWRLTGVKTAVPYGVEADMLLVTASIAGNEPAVFLVDPKTSGVAILAQAATGGEPHAEIRFDDVRLGDDALLGLPAQGAEVVRDLVQGACVGLAALQIGIGDAALRRTADYASARIQFGRPIGSMQAVQQRAADGFIDLEAMRSTYLRAVWALSEGSATDADIATAKYWAATGGHRITHSAQHLHGGVGADVDYPIHRYFLRARQIESALGGATPTLAALGRAIAAGRSHSLTGV